MKFESLNKLKFLKGLSVTKLDTLNFRSGNKVPHKSTASSSNDDSGNTPNTKKRDRGEESKNKESKSKESESEESESDEEITKILQYVSPPDPIGHRQVPLDLRRQRDENNRESTERRKKIEKRLKIEEK